MKKTLLLFTMCLTWAGGAQAADADFTAGKKLFQQQCLVCHAADLDPPKAPPMFGVQMKYKMATADRASFIDKITSFAMHPAEEKAILKKPVQVLGLMPEMGFDERDVRKIAAYIHDETFPPPCKHWQVAMRIFKERGDEKAFRHHKKRYDAMCSTTSATEAREPETQAPTAAPAEAGTLKSVMQQLGRDYAALDHAVLVGDFAAAAVAAEHIANHEKPSMFQRMKIMAVLRTEMSAFKQADDKVHQLAMAIKQAAEKKDMSLLIQRQSGMLSACMACHTAYRSKIKDILK